MVVREVVDNLTVAHIAPDSQAAATAAPLLPQLSSGSNSSGHSSAAQIRLPLPTRANRSTSTSGRLTNSTSTNSTSRQQRLSIPPQALLQSASSISQLNPLLRGRSSSLSSSSHALQSSHSSVANAVQHSQSTAANALHSAQGSSTSPQSASDSESASKESKAVAKQITVLCLRRWDGFLGIRAGSDGLGRQRGIWREKFDGVHSAVLLLAMLKLNQALRNDSTNPSKLLRT